MDVGCRSGTPVPDNRGWTKVCVFSSNVSGTGVPDLLFRPLMTNLSILLIGDAQRGEFREAGRRLDAWGRVSRVADAASAAALLADGRTTADVIVVAQAYPGEFSHAADRTPAAVGSAGSNGGPFGKLVRRRDAHRASPGRPQSARIGISGRPAPIANCAAWPRAAAAPGRWRSRRPRKNAS